MSAHQDAMMEPVAEQLNRILTTLGERVHAAVADQISVTIEQLSAAVETDRRAAVDAATRQAVSDTQREVSTRLIEEFAQREAHIREAARADGLAEGATAAAAAARDLLQDLERLVLAVRALNRATSLSETLDALLRAARAEAERVAIYLVRDGRFRLWSQDGFPALEGTQAVDLAYADADVVGQAVRAREARHGALSRPSFCPDTPAATFVAVPLTLHGHMTAALCADTTIDVDRVPSLFLRLEIMADCASKVLELITAERLARTAGGAPARQGAPASTHI